MSIIVSTSKIIALIRVYSKDGGKSTEATVMDGGPDDAEKDETYKPS